MLVMGGVGVRKGENDVILVKLKIFKDKTSLLTLSAINTKAHDHDL